MSHVAVFFFLSPISLLVDDNPALCCHLNSMFVLIPAVCGCVMFLSDLPPKDCSRLYNVRGISDLNPDCQYPEERTGCVYPSVIVCSEDIQSDVRQVESHH